MDDSKYLYNKRHVKYEHEENARLEEFQYNMKEENIKVRIKQQDDDQIKEDKIILKNLKKTQLEARELKKNNQEFEKIFRYHQYQKRLEKIITHF